MKQNTLTRAAAALVLGLAISPAMAREKWPAPTEEAKQRTADAAKHDAEVWKRIEPEIEEWAKKGKPYIPWAAKPSDLPQAGIPAFPGASGGGMYSFGGRGGKVYVVTSLEDSGTGTYREALEAAGPRIVVFNVAGVVHLKSQVRVQAPYLTIAGQTAPGDGVCIAGASTLIDTHDVVIRYMRFRRGITDVFQRDDALGGDPVGNIMVDHCSCSWGLDENVSMYRHIYDPGHGAKAQKLPTVNITIQWTISSEALDPYNHAFGGTWGGTNDTFHHNLLACNTGRNSSIGMGGDFNFINNVLFNWRHRTLDGGDNTTMGNVINNYYKPGPMTPHTPIAFRVVKPESQRVKNEADRQFGRFYVVGNVVDGNAAVTADNWNGGVQYTETPTSDDAGGPDATTQPTGHSVVLMKPEWLKQSRVDSPFPMTAVPIQPATEAYEAVLAGVGATLPKRDPVDIRIIEEVRTGKVTYEKNKGIITDIAQVGGYSQYSGSPIAYSGNDGIPEWWKTKYGLKLHDASVASADANGDGYTNIEKYLDGLDPTKKVDWKNPQSNVDSLSSDRLSQHTAEK